MKTILVLALVALPATSIASGIDLTWIDCVGSGQERATLDFDCTANVRYDLQFQFKCPVAIPNFVSITAFADYQNDSQRPLSPFWRYEVGGCQQSRPQKGLAIFDHLATGLEGCAGLADPWNGDGSGGSETIAAYGVDFRRPGNGYLILVCYRSDLIAFPIEAGTNYWAFRITFRTNNRDVCAGCTDPGVILWPRATLESNDNSPAINLDNPDKFGNMVTLNRGQPVPIRKTSWGAIKAIYR